MDEVSRSQLNSNGGEVYTKGPWSLGLFEYNHLFLQIFSVFLSLFVNGISQATGAEADSQPAGANIDRGAVIAAQGSSRAPACAECHAFNGSSDGSGAFPRITGLPADYFESQLRDFASGIRNSAIMSPIAKSLSPDEIKDVTAYYASASAPFPPLKSTSAALIKLGKQLAAAGDDAKGIPGCDQCHGPKGNGELGIAPYLGGQYADYIAFTLHMWQRGYRKNSPDLMQAFAQKLDDQQIAAVAAYYQQVHESEAAQATAGMAVTVRPVAAETLLNAQQDDANWILPAKTYAGNRYTGLSQIDKTNVGTLRMAWKTKLADDGEEEASPIVWNGIMYLSTPHDGVLALDASTGKLIWQTPYNPEYVLLFAVNRGVGLADGKVVIATQDCRVIALDAATGKSVWNVQGCQDTSNSWYSMAAYVYKNKIILGTGGGDNGNIGLVSAFSIDDGKRRWDWQTIPGPGEPEHDTWPGDSWKHGGGPVWSGLAIDQDTDTLFVAPGNPGPDFVDKGRSGKNLYTNSLVALDISGEKPKIKWYYQIIENDTHDADPAMIPVLFEGQVNGQARQLVAIGDKAGNFVLLDRKTGEAVHRLVLSKQVGLDVHQTFGGTEACPNHGGGIQWNGGAYDPNSNSFIVPSTEECGLWKITTDDPQYIPGQVYTGGPFPKRQNGTGRLTSIDVSTGKLRWRHPLPYPAQGGVLITKTGLAFTSDVGGNIYAFDAASGNQYWKESAGSAVVAPISAYSLNGAEYLAVVVGEAGNQQTPNLPASEGSYVIVYGLGGAPTIMNDSTGQVALANPPKGLGGYSEPSKSTGSAPYTKQQVAEGSEVYAKECAVCHGANLQGISAPALTGPGFGRSHLNASQLRGVVVQTMPLTAPGSLKPDEYAAVMAFLLSYDCVQPAGDGQQPFPATDLAALQQVELGSATCAPQK